ncbi:MAG: hypothetical protein J5I90_16785 [Caldilineales bacterium]|nr:hypothetical protein [Caldilineales bacterium]
MNKSNVEARALIFQRLRAAAPGSSIPTPDDKSEAQVPAIDDTVTGRSVRFCSQMATHGAVCEIHDDDVNARLALLLRLREADCTHLITHDVRITAVPGLSESLLDSGVEISSPQSVAHQTELTIGLAVADAGLVQTGSLIFGSAGPRSWLPILASYRLYLLVRRSQLYETMAQWRLVDATGGWGASAGRVLIMTGPSVSGDVELHPHYGLYGPHSLHVFVIRG